MPRIRTLKPEFWGDEKLGPMDTVTRLVFLGLISMADDGGRILDSVKAIDGFLFAYTSDTCRRSLDDLSTTGRIQRGLTGSGQRVIQITNWHHQKIDKPNVKGMLPPITQALTPNSTIDRRLIDDASAPLPTTNDLLPVPSTKDQRPATSDPREAIDDGEDESDKLPEPRAFQVAAEQLPPEAREFLGRFYEPALTARARERYRDVLRQLLDTIDPNHPGAKLRGGQRSKARSVAHLADCCRAVSHDPPINRDSAIVFLLNKLLDPVKGASVTEVHQKVERERRDLEGSYQRAQLAAGRKWAKANPTEYAPILQDVQVHFHGVEETSITKMAKDAMLAQRTAKAAGFPSFDAWTESRAEPATAGAA